LKAVGVSLNSKGELPLINAPYKIGDRTFNSQSLIKKDCTFNNQGDRTFSSQSDRIFNSQSNRIFKNQNDRGFKV
jgi:hypothetical protein